MSRAAMLRRSELRPVAPEPVIYTRSALAEADPGQRHVAHCEDGPTPILARATAEEALRDAREFVLRHYRWSALEGRWVRR